MAGVKRGKDTAPSNYLRVGFLAVLADFTKSALVGAPLLPGALIFSPLPALIRACLALMFA
jgi:hypothetical protein